MTGQGTSLAEQEEQFQHSIVRPLDFANKAEAKRTAARGPSRLTHLLSMRTQQALFCHQGAPSLSVTSDVIPKPFTPVAAAHVVVQ